MVINFKQFVATTFYLLLLTAAAQGQITYCPSAPIVLTSSITGAQYQWQVDSGNGFENLTPIVNITGVTSSSLNLLNPSSAWARFQFRCIVDNDYAAIIRLQAENRWTGVSNSAFNDARNWSCGIVPDENTAVIISNDTVDLTVNKTIRSLNLTNGAFINILPGIALTLGGKDTLLSDFNLTMDDLDFLDSITIDVPFGRPTNATTVSNEKSVTGILIDTLLVRGKRMCALKSETYTSDTGAVGAPLIYKGLAYSYGSRQVTTTAQPKEGDPFHKKYPVLGTDCSGMMIILLKSAGIPISENATTVDFEERLRTVLKDNVKYPTLRLINLDSLPAPKIAPGDFMLWSVKRHVGIIDTVVGGRILYQSNGNPHPTTQPGCAIPRVNNICNRYKTEYEDQISNWGPKRGSSVKLFRTAVFGSGYWGTKYKLLRFAEVFNTSNTAVFTTNTFNAVQVGKGGYIYAGTSNQGLYKYNGTNWEKLTVLTNNNINHIQRDKNEGLWIAQSGSTGAQALGGGIAYLPDTTYTGYVNYGATVGAPTRFCRSIFIDTTRLHLNVNPRVWTAHMSDVTGGVSSTGAVGLGVNSAAPFFAKITRGIETTNGLGSVQSIGGNSTEIWAFASVNFGRSQIRRYDAATGDSMSPIGAYDYTNTPALSSNFAARAIYFDKSDNRWIGFASGGVVVKSGVNWITLNSPALFPAGTLVNTNAITGNDSGEVFIGTTNGLLIYNGIGAISDVNSYKKMTAVQGLPSSNVKGVCYDKVNKRLILATDAGILVLKYL